MPQKPAKLSHQIIKIHHKHVMPGNVYYVNPVVHANVKFYVLIFTVIIV